MPFDPDAFAAGNLEAAVVPESNVFDPDAFASGNLEQSIVPESVARQKEGNESRQKAIQFLQEVTQGLHPNITEEELLPIVKVASQDESGNQTTPLQRLGKQAGNVADLLVNPMKAAPIVVDLAKQGWEGVKSMGSELVEDSSIPGKTGTTLAAGAVGDTASFAGSLGINASAGVSNLITQAAEKLTGQEFDDQDLTNARAAIVEGKMNRSIKGTAEAIGVDPESSTYHAGGLIGQAFIPIGGEAKAAGMVAKTAEGISSAVPKAAGIALEKTAQVAQNKGVQAATALATGNPMVAAGILAEGAAEKLPGIGRYLRTWRMQAMDSTLGRIEDLGTVLRGSPDADTITGALLNDAQQILAKNEARIADRMATKGITPESDVFKKHGDDWLHPEESLPKNEREIRQILIENENQAKKIRQLEGLNDYNKVASYAGKLGLATAGNIGVGTGIGGIIGGIMAQPGDDESAKHMAVMMGAFAAPFAPIHASKALKEIRAEAGREAFKEAGKDSITPDNPYYEPHQNAYASLRPEGKEAIDVANGMLKSMGGKGVVILPKEKFIEVQGGDATKAPGRGFVRDGTIYLNGEHVSQGVLGHELSHFLPQALGQSVFDLMPGLKGKMEGQKTSQAYKEFEEYYNSLSPDSTKTNIPEEVLAETGRRILTDMPPELFYGGESGADVLKRWGGKILGKVAPEWYQKNNIDPILKAPISKADEAAVRARLFEASQRRGQEPPRSAPDEPPATTMPPGPSKAPTAPIQTPEAPISAPPGAVEALTGLGEPKKSAQAKVDAATAEILSENGQPTLEEVVRRAVRKTVPVSINAETPLGKRPAAPESSLSQAMAPTEGRSDAPKAPPAPAPIEEIPPQPAPTTNPVPASDIGSSGNPKVETPSASSGISLKKEGSILNENSMLVGLRTDKYGRKSVSGREFDPALPEHAALAEKAGLDEANIAKLKELSDKMGETVGIDYSHAPEEGLGRKDAQKKTLAQARIEGAKREKLSKTFVPTWIEFTSGTNKAVVRGFSPDKFYENVAKVFQDHPEVMEGKYKDVNDPQLISDFQKYAQNHANGYTGMGKPIEGTELTPVKPNANFEPNIIPEDRASVINLLMGDTSAAEGVRKSSPVKLEKQALAKANAPFFDEAVGETNKIRATKGDMGLESVSETLRPELIDKIREPNVADEHTIRPSGAAPETRASLAKAGTPNSTYAASGFMPGKRRTNVELHRDYVEAEWNEGEDGHWLQLRPGLEVDGSTAIHESTRAKAMQRLKDVRPAPVNNSDKFMPDSEFKGKTIEAGEPPWSIRLKELETREWNGTKLAPDEEKELLDLHKQAKTEYGSYANWFEKSGAEKDYISQVFGDEKQKQAFMPTPHIEREAQRLGLEYKGDMGEGKLHLFNDPITKSTISIKSDAEKGTLQEKLKASRDKFRASDKTNFMPSSDPRAIDRAAIKMPDGKIFTGLYHGDALASAERVYPELDNPDNIVPKGTEIGFVDKSGEFLNRLEAEARAAEVGQLQHDSREGLEAEDFERTKRFMPPSEAKVPESKEPRNIKSMRAIKPPEKDEKKVPIDFKIGTKADGFNTPLTAKEVVAFDAWKTKYAPKDSGKDFDLRGAFKAGMKPKDGHWPDTFKKPNHPTFSDESVYANETAGKWAGEKFIPKKKKLSDAR